MLHFCREPNLYRAGENHSYCRRVGITLLVSKPLKLSCDNYGEYLAQVEAHHCLLRYSPIRSNPGVDTFVVGRTINSPLFPAVGIEPTPVSVIKPLTTTFTGMWCQEKDSNLRPIGYEPIALVN